MSFVWTVAGSDCSGGAGLQADLQTFASLGVHGCSIVTAVTAQNLQQFHQTFMMSHAAVRAQIQALHVAMPPAAVKIGMLGDHHVVDVLLEFLVSYQGFVVLDPVLVSSSGGALYLCHDYIKTLSTLFPYAHLITPNLREGEMITGIEIDGASAAVAAAEALLDMGAGSVIIKGGHGGNALSQDYWTDGKESFWLSSPRRMGVNCHGTGCVFSSAVAAAMAQDYALKDALIIAKMVVNRGLRMARSSAMQTLFRHTAGWPEDECDLPYLTSQAEIFWQDSVHADEAIGLYPVVNSVEWMRKLLPLGIKYIQLRIKDKSGEMLEREIAAAVKLAREYRACLFINDYWQLAIRFGAFGVHLGQEDLAVADVAAIRAAGLKLGISTHCYEEVARAHAYQPFYLACGPIFATTSKKMSFAPQGLEALSRWRRTLRYPLVAIGGIHEGNIDAVAATGVDGIAMISAITEAQNPVAAAMQLSDMVCHHAA